MNRRERGARRLWRGLVSLAASVTALAIAGGNAVNVHRTEIDRFLGTSSTRVVIGADASDLYPYASDYATTGELVRAVADISERISAEGTVLLKNNGALPLSEEEKGKVSLLGYGSYHPVTGVTVHNLDTDADTVDFIQALAARGFGCNPALESAFDTPADGGDGWQDALAAYPVLILTFSRDMDSAPELSEEERALIRSAVEAKAADRGKLIVLLNSPAAMEIRELEENGAIDAILQIGLPGGYGFYAVCDLLDGTANPSGRLGDTYAVSMEPVEAEELDGTRTGYRYYETRYADRVLNRGGTWDYAREVTYPFGFGLSYTTFRQELESVRADVETGTAVAYVTVTNTGTAAGRDAVQLYVSVPCTDDDRERGVEKSAIQLLDYAKTGVIAPGESELVELEADLRYMASWDSGAPNEAGTAGNYILDEGMYYFSVGNGAHDALNHILSAQGMGLSDGMTAEGDETNVRTWNLGERAAFGRSRNGAAVENRLTESVDRVSRSGSAVVFGAENGMTLAERKGDTEWGSPAWNQLLDQITPEDCLTGMEFDGAFLRAAESIGSPEVPLNGGANGLSCPLGQYAGTDPADPCAVDAADRNRTFQAGVMGDSGLLARTFNKRLAGEYGAVMGNYSLWANVPVWTGIHARLRGTPYGAYDAEDPVLLGYQCAAVVEGARRYGLIAGVEPGGGMETEQAAREGIWRAVQASIEDAGAGCVLADAAILPEGLLREEWGFHGIRVAEPGDNAPPEADLSAAKQAMAYQAYVLANSSAMDGYSARSRVESVRTWYDNALTGAAVVSGPLALLCAARYLDAGKKTGRRVRY